MNRNAKTLRRELGQKYLEVLRHLFDSCYECSNPAEVYHHVVPHAVGGTQTVPLCEQCHTKAHQFSTSRRALIMKGLERARGRGIRLGRPPKQIDITPVVDLYVQGRSVRQIARALNRSPSSVHRHITLYKGNLKNERK